jgi:cytochrome c
MAIVALIPANKEEVKSIKNRNKRSRSRLMISLQQVGKLFFLKENCIACHNVDSKLIGPSLRIVKIYIQKRKTEISYHFKRQQAIVDPEQYMRL